MTFNEEMLDSWSNWSSFSVNYNEAGFNDSLRWPDLRTSPKNYPLSTDIGSYSAILSFNQAQKWPGISVYDADGQNIQMWTLLTEFPTNLLVALELREYGLFYLRNADRLYFGKLPKGWYNTQVQSELFEEFLRVNRISKPGALN